MKELIDCFNERYTRKKEYICKDLKPVKLLNDDEYSDFRNDAGLINPQEIHYYPLFKVPKIKDNRPASFGYILKTDDKEYKGIMRQRNNNEYGNNSVKIVINEDEVVLDAYGISINVNNCFLTLYIDSPELPKLEYPKNKMDMYRAYNFIYNVNNYISDMRIKNLISNINPLFPENIDEADLYLDNILGYIFKDIELKISAQYMDVEEFIGGNWNNDIPKPSDKGWCINLPLNIYFLPDKVIFEKNGKDEVFNKYSCYSLDERYNIYIYETDDFYVFRSYETEYVLKMIFFDENIDLNNTILKCFKYINLTAKGFYCLNPNKDNYYTILNAIKEGKTIYANNYNILPYWEINKEEKKIYLKSSYLQYLAEASENGILMGQSPQ